MAIKTLADVRAGTDFQGAGPLFLSQAERELLQRSTITWACLPWLAEPEAGGMVNSLVTTGESAAYAAPVSGSTLPTWNATGGPTTSSPYLLFGSAAPVGAMRTPASVVQHPTAFTFDFVGFASSAANGTHMGVEGSTGNAFGAGLRTGNYMAVYTYNGAGAPTEVSLISDVSSSDWHHVVVSYKHSDGGELKIWVDGTLEDTVANQITFATSRLNLGQAYDTGVTVNSGCANGGLASAWVFSEYAGDDDALITILNEAASARFGL